MATLTKQDGYVVNVPILDRRWKWKYGSILGAYNIRDTNIRLDTATEKTPQELATLLLRAMGERRFSVGELPNKSRPTKRWIYANPAQELDILCRELGCVVSLGLDNVVRIHKVGVGRVPPKGKTVTVSYSINPADIPDSIGYVGGKTEYQIRWDTEAVGIDTDGSVKLLDDLSYTPSSGWSSEFPMTFPNVLDQFGEKEHSLATKSVWKMYRITKPVSQTKPFNHSRLLVLPITDRLIETKYNSTTGKYDPIPAIIRGKYWKGYNTPYAATKNTDKNTEIDVDHSIDTSTGIITFTDPVIKLGDNNDIASADITLEMAYNAKGTVTKPTNIFDRATYEQRVSPRPSGTGPMVVREESVLRTLQASGYGSDGIPTNVKDNSKQFVQLAREFVQAKLAQFRQVDSFTTTYAGFKAVNLSGAITQIAWSFGRQGGTTKVGYNNEFLNTELRRPAKQLLSLQRSTTEKLHAIANQQE